MIAVSALLLPLMLGAFLIFKGFQPRSAPSGRLRTFNACAWLGTLLAVVGAVLLVWNGSMRPVDHNWWLVAAAFFGAVTFILSMLAATVVRHFVFRSPRA
ncbi:hypothetical protein [Marilutibacter spongiae]|uniref:Uncharacterized protein n=1 Tax=Marilutibacter spongiae TaxID=2025720 RepID=A0A7W3TPJ1_9GAMM|nr:hypothetical protein [Lysobacter spongiae]MBB1062138.1 hypothetical protein [Lysobacter spongiae]